MEQKKPKSLIKISFGDGPKTPPEMNDQDDMENENHSAVLSKMRSQLEKIPGTDSILSSIDQFLNKDASYGQKEKSEEDIMSKVTDLLKKKGMVS